MEGIEEGGVISDFPLRFKEWQSRSRRMNGNLKKKLVANIKRVLDQPITDSGVKLFLIDTRRLLEVVGKTGNYKTLKFYCDWVLHPRMSGKTASRLLEDFDDVWDRWVTQRIKMPQNFESTLGYQLGFYGFEQELQEFLASQNIRMVAPPLRVNWHLLETTYCNLVNDCWLEYSGKKILKHINGARVEVVRVRDMTGHQNDGPPDYCPSGIAWIFMYNFKDVLALNLSFMSEKAGSEAKQDGSSLIFTPPLYRQNTQ